MPSSRGEKTVIELVEKLYGPCSTRYRRVGKQMLFFDYISDRYKIIIEADGRQHHCISTLFHRHGGKRQLELQRKRDQLKDAWALLVGYDLLRLVTYDPRTGKPLSDDRLRVHARAHIMGQWRRRHQQRAVA